MSIFVSKTTLATENKNYMVIICLQLPFKLFMIWNHFSYLFNIISVSISIKVEMKSFFEWLS